MNPKSEKFKVLAEKRVNRTIKDIRLIGNLSNRNNYSYTEQEAAKICAILESEIKLLKTKFVAVGNSTEPFKL
jgi:translation initiation factor 6 (eIF-6)